MHPTQQYNKLVNDTAKRVWTVIEAAISELPEQRSKMLVAGRVLNVLYWHMFGPVLTFNNKPVKLKSEEEE